ncbi:UDP-N-acetylmuramoyl-tripeptide--D-alanyl-D-alanine ligase [Vibrio sp. 10N.286.49.C2]|uniref:UDP-N-acetylmuramoyl-tripeptide--D-alanyl-D- alanine ligase n=1 Tax=unclassified Vibrio TaxID=2614977 RepID=UPI000C82C070|nr:MULTISPECIES: UDP-N-acetylmuramoyl-tripeptide--D-alanyl-D-alanine ligase [unclassified Vibrio]PMH29519.1 UDP-N-acetylmuramoyl-tripeptide--D-alanyl-D-alanine ligase [Vibrio sp. 10N.286.49.C2]PMH56034.1 UDP-N-acetylmuramoyl-tripeptide--D-alanyl-D-alanine ligase [Vibrio sp. 10N.286.49.B1]
MITLTLSDITHAVGGTLMVGEHTKCAGPEMLIEAVTTDTRAIEQGALFIALVGERFDAHDFVTHAKDSGAVAVIVERKLDVDVTQIVVDDSLKALGHLGEYVHQQAKSKNRQSKTAKTIGITGSCGKTTVKEMVASILNQQGQVLYTAGNFNNDIGVPLTLLRSTENDDFSVIEMGANHVGEIAYTTQLTHPDIAIVNNVAEAHLEGFGSLQGVKQAKGEIYQGLEASGTALVNLDSHGGELWNDVLSDKKVVTFAQQNPDADYFASDIVMSSQGSSSFTLHTPIGQVAIELGLIGLHNVSNAIASAALAVQCDSSLLQIQLGLKTLNKVKGRVEVEKLTETITLIDDSYNASVPAMKAAVDLLSQFNGERWLILGNMAELGHESLALHKEVGQHAAPFAFDHVLTYGEDAKVISDLCSGMHFQSHDVMLDYIEQHLLLLNQTSHTLLVKGANSAGMFKIATALKENFS